MTPRWVWWLPVGVLLIVAALLGYRQGWLAANMTETAAIELYAARYMEETGAPAADCVAVPGAEVWLIVRCGEDGAAYEYHVNRFGGLIQAYGPGATPNRHLPERRPET